MGGKRKKHKPTYKPKNTPENKQPERPIQRSESSLMVFISSKIGTMMSERDAADRAIKPIPITGSWRFEYTPASSQSLEDSYLLYVRRCDIFVLLLGLEHSDAVEREYQTAVENQRPILAFVQKGIEDSKQNALVDKLDLKYAFYTSSDNLQRLVLASVLDEVVRRFKSTLRQAELPNLIESLPAPVRAREEVLGYILVGMEDDTMDKIFELFGVERSPDNLEELYPAYKQVYFDNFSEMNEVFTAFINADAKAKKATGDRQKAWLRALREESLELASQHMIRKRSGKQAPQVEGEGYKCFIWSVAPDVAGLMRMMRPAQIGQDSPPIQKTEYEYLFESPEQLVDVLNAINKASRDSGDDEDEFLRLLLLAAMHMRMPRLEDYIDAEDKDEGDADEE